MTEKEMFERVLELAETGYAMKKEYGEAYPTDCDVLMKFREHAEEFIGQPLEMND